MRKGLGLAALKQAYGIPVPALRALPLKVIWFEAAMVALELEVGDMEVLDDVLEGDQRILVSAMLQEGSLP